MLFVQLGQFLSLQSGVLPEETLAELGHLQRGAPGMHPSLVRAQFRAAMGTVPDAVFRSFDEEPFAAASLGQVHRAELPNGHAVAVKVQHPGIDRAIESDLSNIGFLESFVGALGPRSLESGRVLDEVRARFREELDYRLEADRQEQFRALHAADPRILIPRVVRERNYADNE